MTTPVSTTSVFFATPLEKTLHLPEIQTIKFECRGVKLFAEIQWTPDISETHRNEYGSVVVHSDDVNVSDEQASALIEASTPQDLSSQQEIRSSLMNSIKLIRLKEEIMSLYTQQRLASMR